MTGPAFLTRADLMHRWAAVPAEVYGPKQSDELKTPRLIGPPCCLCGCRIRKGTTLRHYRARARKPRRDPFGRKKKEGQTVLTVTSFVCHEECFQHWAWIASNLI